MNNIGPIEYFELNKDIILSKKFGELSTADCDKFQRAVESTLVDEFNLDTSLATSVAQGIKIKLLTQKFKNESGQIPIYIQEKQRRNGDWDPKRHFDFYYKPYKESGALFLDELRRLDMGFVDALASWARRHGEDAKELLPPSRNKQTEMYSGLVFEIFGRRGLLAGQAMSNRRVRSGSKGMQPT